MATAILAAFVTACGTGERSSTSMGGLKTGQGVQLPLVPGQHWGGFLLCDQPAPCILSSDQVTPAPRPLKDGEGDLLFSRHPGYREFETIDDLARFIDGRAVLRMPRFLPADAELVGGYAVAGDDGRVFVVGLSYGLGESNAGIDDPDLWINYDLYTPRPLAIRKPVQQPESNSVYDDVLLTVRGQAAIFQPSSGSNGRGSLNWFEDDGSFWTVQARGLDLTTLAEVAESLADSSGS